MGKKIDEIIYTVCNLCMDHEKAEYIDLVIVGKSPLKQGILSFFISKGVIFQDSKDPRQYKLNNQVLESFGVNWGLLSTIHSGPMKDLFSAYKAYIKK